MLNTLWPKAKNSCKPVQFNWWDSSRVKHKALSVDHLEIMTTEDIEALKKHRNDACSPTFLFLFLSIPYTRPVK
jgi:hypothetical protein